MFVGYDEYNRTIIGHLQLSTFLKIPSASLLKSILLLLVSFLSYQLLGGLLLANVDSEGPNGIMVTRMVMVLSQLLFLVVPAIVFVKCTGGRIREFVPAEHVGLLPVAMVVLTVSGLFVAFQSYIVFQNQVLLALLPPGTRAAMEQYSMQVRQVYLKLGMADSWSGMLIPWSVIALVPAFCEEFVFRGLLLGYMRQHRALWAAVVINGFTFSLFHMQPETFLPLTVVGAVLAVFTLRARSIFPAIIGHLANNTLAVFSIYLSGGGVESAGANGTPDSLLGISLLGITGLAIATAAFALFWVRTRPSVDVSLTGE
jgi:membrane protease YdiL (CAAX protease family)